MLITGCEPTLDSGLLFRSVRLHCGNTTFQMERRCYMKVMQMDKHDYYTDIIYHVHYYFNSIE